VAPSLRERATASLRETSAGRVLARARDAAEGLHSIATWRSARRRRHGALVLLYHGVVPRLTDPFVEAAHVEAGLFRRQIRHLIRHYRVVSLEEIHARLEEGGPLPDDWVALTFDDGYRNNLTCARQILREEGGLPMALFVVTDFPGTQATIPTVLLRMCLLHTRSRRLRVPQEDGTWRTVDLPDRRTRVNAYWSGHAALRAVGASAGRALLDEFLDQLDGDEVEEIRTRFTSFDWLDWDEVRELAADGVVVGSHTCSHPSLRSELGEERLRVEIAASRRRILEEVGRVSDHFAYPYGADADVDGLAVGVLRAEGVKGAFTTLPGTIRGGDDPYRLRRMSGCVGRMGRFRRVVASGRQ